MSNRPRIQDVSRAKINEVVEGCFEELAARRSGIRFTPLDLARGRHSAVLHAQDLRHHEIWQNRDSSSFDKKGHSHIAFSHPFPVPASQPRSHGRPLLMRRLPVQRRPRLHPSPRNRRTSPSPSPFPLHTDPRFPWQFGGVTCDRGVCIAHGCLEEEGYELVGSTCLLRGSQPNVTPPTSTSASRLSVISSSTPNNRYTLAPRSPPMHITHRSQARIDPNTIVTIYLQYSGVDLSSSTSDDVGGGVRMMETSAEVDGSGFREVLERIRKMGNVRIVEADGT
jgi:hypothetical protein